MGSPIISWLANNWLAIISLIVGVWVAFALRPHPKIRYWIMGLDDPSGPYGPGGHLFGAPRTRLHLRNVGSEPIDAEQWEVPLVIEFDKDANITAIDCETSHANIKTVAEVISDEPHTAVLRISHLDPSDEVAFDIQHASTRVEPQLHGKIRGSRDSLARGLTIRQRLLGLISFLLTRFPLDYIAIASIPWLLESRLDLVGVLRGILFLLASPLFEVASAVLFRHAALERRPDRAAKVGCGMYIVTRAIRVIAFFIAWFAGYRLWYPQIVIYLAAVLVFVLACGIRFWEIYVQKALPETKVSPAIVIFVANLSNALFAILVATGADPNVLLSVGLVCAFTCTAIRLDSQQLRYRLHTALRTPGGHLLKSSLRP